MNQAPNQVVSPPLQPRKATSMVFRAVLFAILVLVLSAVGILYGQRIVDKVKASQFRPTAQVAQVTERVGMSHQARDIFYATSPVVEDRAQFNNSCQSQERTVAILGCYYRDRIYLFNIDNKELDGTLEVTAAHEMLHAAYQRLNIFERARVDALVEAEYAKLKDDANLQEIMKYYHTAEPGAESNELHSIIGTTVVTIDPELEQYYKGYFSDRQQVVALNTAYNKVFGDMKARADELQARLKEAEPTITADLTAYDADLKQLELDIESFNQQATTGYYSTRAAFNATRNALVARVDAMNARRDTINTNVAKYNADVKALNDLSVQVNSLYQSINGVEAATTVE